jgi:hypothetical protein
MSKTATRNALFQTATTKMSATLAGACLIAAALALPLFLITTNGSAETLVPYVTITVEGAPSGS